MARREYVNSRLSTSQQQQLRAPKSRTGRWLARLTTLQSRCWPRSPCTPCC
jgi:hypothetical protein